MSADGKIFALPYGVDFASEFAKGLIARRDKNSDEFRNAVILVNSNRAKARFRAIWQEFAPIIAPEVITFDEAAQFFLPDAPRFSQKPAIERVFELAALIKALAKQLDIAIAERVYFEMAYSLGDLLDELSERDICPEALRALDLGALAAHWQVNLDFIELVMDYARRIEGENAYDGVKALNLEIDRLAQHWHDTPPSFPIYLVGSTGSRVFAQKLMRAVCGLPQGGVVLPGFDFELDEASWSRLTPDHAQFGFAHLAEILEVSTSAIEPWTDCPTTARAKLLSLATAPAPVTDRWVSVRAEYEALAARALQNVSMVFAENEREEAKAIASILAHCAHEGLKTALVTPNRHLVRQVTNFLDDHSIDYNDSAGRPMQLTPIGIFFTLLLDSAENIKKSTISALMAHPFTQAFDTKRRAAHLKLYRWFDIDILRQTRLGKLRQTAETALKHTEDPAPYFAWLDWLEALMCSAPTDALMPLSDWVNWHIERARFVFGVKDDAALVFPSANEGDNKLLDLLAGLSGNKNVARPISFRDYVNFWSIWLSRQSAVAASEDVAPKVRILGTIEARIEQFDVTILSGLNEGVWPEGDGGEQWVNRAMRRELNLELPERFIGLSAHDFLIGASAPNVVFTRAKKSKDAENIEARWLRRLRILSKGLGRIGETALNEAEARGAYWLEMARVLGAPSGKNIEREKRPWPVPPVSARPKTHSVTAISTYMNDPYAYYARYILGLNPLPSLDDEFNAREQGILSHDFLEALVPKLLQAPQDADWLYDEELEAAIARAELSVDEAASYRLERQLTKADYLTEEMTRLLGVKSTHTEIQLKLVSETEYGAVKLKAKADRIDLSQMNEAIIYDYKSAASQFGKSLNTAQHPQLPLEAYILSKTNKFEDVNGTQISSDNVANIAILDIKNNTMIAPKTLEIDQYDDLYTAFLDELFDPETGFYAIVPEKNGYLGQDYAHLARFGVWFAHDMPEKEYLDEEYS